MAEPTPGQPRTFRLSSFRLLRLGNQTAADGMPHTLTGDACISYKAGTRICDPNNNNGNKEDRR